MTDAPRIESFAINDVATPSKNIQVEGSERFVHERDFQAYKAWAALQVEAALAKLPAFPEPYATEYANGWNRFRERLVAALAQTPREEAILCFDCRGTGQMANPDNHDTAHPTVPCLCTLPR